MQVRDTGITAGNEAKTGYYAGCIVSDTVRSRWATTERGGQESIFYASEALTVVFWGRISDHIGRRPPLVWGTLGTAAAILSFGLSKSFWMLVISRSLLGVFNGNIGISKTFIAEITDSTNIARGTVLHIRNMCNILNKLLLSFIFQPADVGGRCHNRVSLLFSFDWPVIDEVFKTGDRRRALQSSSQLAKLFRENSVPS